MTDEYMTLAEALATGLPFKHKKHKFWSNTLAWISWETKEMYEPVWQVQRPKPKMRVWIGHREDRGRVCLAFGCPLGEWEDITDQLKDILKDEE